MVWYEKAPPAVVVTVARTLLPFSPQPVARMSTFWPEAPVESFPVNVVV